MVSMHVSVYADKEEVWRKFLHERAKMRQMTREKFVETLAPVQRFIRNAYSDYINNVWLGLYDSEYIRPELFLKKGKQRGEINFYFLLNLIGFMMQHRDFNIFVSGTCVSDICKALVPDTKQSQAFCTGRKSYDITEYEQQFCRILRKNRL